MLRGAMPLALIGLAAEIAIMYGRSINNGFVGDDWPLLNYGNHGVLVALAWEGGYHFNPITQLFILLLLQIIGLRPLVYHIVAYLLFWLDAALILVVGRRITGRLSIGALAGALYITFGSQYESVIWGVVSFFQLGGLAVYLGGLLLYIRAHDPQLALKRRNQSYIGFLVAVILAPFVYEQSVSLVVACALYRFLVIEDTAGFSAKALLARANAWLRDFTVPAAFLVCYLAMKWWMGRHSTTFPMAPGLEQPWVYLAVVATTGFFRALLPGLGPQGASWLVPGDHYRRVIFVVLLVLTVCFLLVKPVYRFLIAWTAVLIVFSTLGLGVIAPRHLTIILAPSAILWAGFLIYLADKVRSRLEQSSLPNVWAARLAIVPSVVLAITFSFAGFRYAAIQQDAWAAGARSVQDVVARVGVYARANPTVTTLYVVDLPDSNTTITGDTVYLFRNVPQVFVQLAFPGRFKVVIAVRTYEYGYAWDYSIRASEDQIAQWSRQPGTLVLWYDNATEQLRQWLPTSLNATS
jgi:hypothetical protein